MQVGLKNMNSTSLFISINFYHKLCAELESGDEGDALMLCTEGAGKAVDGVPLLFREEAQIGYQLPAGLFRFCVHHGTAF